MTSVLRAKPTAKWLIIFVNRRVQTPEVPSFIASPTTAHYSIAEQHLAEFVVHGGVTPALFAWCVAFVIRTSEHDAVPQQGDAVMWAGHVRCVPV